MHQEQATQGVSVQSMHPEENAQFPAPEPVDFIFKFQRHQWIFELFVSHESHTQDKDKNLQSNPWMIENWSHPVTFGVTQNIPSNHCFHTGLWNQTLERLRSKRKEPSHWQKGVSYSHIFPNSMLSWISQTWELEILTRLPMLHWHLKGSHVEWVNYKKLSVISDKTLVKNLSYLMSFLRNIKSLNSRFVSPNKLTFKHSHLFSTKIPPLSMAIWTCSNY